MKYSTKVQLSHPEIYRIMKYLGVSLKLKANRKRQYKIVKVFRMQIAILLA